MKTREKGLPPPLWQPPPTSLLLPPLLPPLGSLGVSGQQTCSLPLVETQEKPVGQESARLGSQTWVQWPPEPSLRHRPELHSVPPMQEVPRSPGVGGLGLFGLLGSLGLLGLFGSLPVSTVTETCALDMLGVLS